MPEFQINAPNLTALHQINISLIPISVTLFIKLFFFFFFHLDLSSTADFYLFFYPHATELFEEKILPKVPYLVQPKKRLWVLWVNIIFFIFSPILQQPMPSILCQLQGSVFPYTNINSYKSLCGTACAHPYTFICLGIDSAAK